MPTADDFETRLTTVEREVARLRDQATLTGSDATAARADAAASRLLAAGADHDVSEVRAERHAHTQALNALRETQLEQGAEITDLRTEMRDGFAEQGRRIDGLGHRIDGLEREMREGFATMGTGMAQITALLTNLGGSEGLE